MTIRSVKVDGVGFQTRIKTMPEMSKEQREALGAQGEPGQPVAQEVPTEPAQPQPGVTQEPPPMNPDVGGAASPVSPTGTEPEEVEPAEPEQDPLANTNVVGTTIPPRMDANNKPE